MRLFKNICYRYLVLAYVFLCLVLISAKSNGLESQKLAANIITDDLLLELKTSFVPTLHIHATLRNTATVEDALSQLRKITPTTQGVYDYGYSDKEYWIGLSLENSSTKNLELFIEIDHSLLDYIDYYLIDTSTEKILQKIQTGDKFPFKQRPIAHPKFVFPLKIAQKEMRTIVFRISTDSSNQIPIRVWSKDGITNHTQSKAAIASFLIGTTIIFGLYNLLLFLILRDSSYLYLSACSLGYALAVSIFSGFGYYYLWPNSPYWHETSLPVISNIILSSLCLFTRKFLSLNKSNDLLSNTLYILAILGGVLTLLSFVMPYYLMVKLISLNTLLSHTTCYIAGFYLSFKRDRNGYIYLACISVLAIGSIFFILGKTNIIKNNIFLENAIHLSVSLSLVFLCLSLADRINAERKKRENAQRDSINNLKKYQTIYESSITGIFRFSTNGNLIDSNPAFNMLMKIKETDFNNGELHNISGLIPKHLKDKERLITLLLQQRRVVGFETLCRSLTGEEFWGSIHARGDETENGAYYIDASIIDITEKVRNNEKLNFIANHDILTGLSNRLNFEKNLSIAIDSAKHSDNKHALLFMDLDQFKIINDTAGHSAGDELLKQMATLFRKHIRKNDSVARLGGDEFVILLSHIQIDVAEKIANTLREGVSNYRFSWKEKVFSIGISIGVVPICKECVSTEHLMGLADTACYIAKDAGRNNVYVYTSSEDSNLPERQTEMALSGQLREAINSDSLLLYKQKILSHDHNTNLDYYEVLIRMQSKSTVLLPGSFLPAAERFDLIEKLDVWVINATLKYLHDRPDRLEKLYQANINISGRTISSSRFEAQLLDLFDQYQVPKEKICFEITESTAISNLVQTSKFLTRMVEQGFKFALDDFGSGFSSFSYLKVLPICSLKIDGSFVKNIVTDPVDRAMVKSITNVAHMMGITVTAEFVENENILSILKEMGVDSVQGFHIHKPELLV